MSDGCWRAHVPDLHHRELKEVFVSPNGLIQTHPPTIINPQWPIATGELCRYPVGFKQQLNLSSIIDFNLIYCRDMQHKT